MSTQLDFKSILGLTRRFGKSCVAAFDVLSNWRDRLRLQTSEASARCSIEQPPPRV